jgi:hypothetical protein
MPTDPGGVKLDGVRARCKDAGALQRITGRVPQIR